MTTKPHPPHAIVTGASRGIGRAIAIALGQAGYAITINYNSNVDAAEEAVQLVKNAGGNALAVRANLGDVNDHQKLLDIGTNAFGPVTALVNNAGVAPKVRADMLDMGEESYDFVLDTNLKGAFFLTQRIAKHMIESKVADSQEGLPTITNVSSISAYTASTNRGEYCIAKAGLSMVTKLFATRLAEHGINVYEIRPGVIATDMTSGVKEKYDKLIIHDEPGITPIKRWGKPEDIASAVRAIVTGQFPYSTGEVFNIDGGFHLHRL